MALGWAFLQAFRWGFRWVFGAAQRVLRQALARNTALLCLEADVALRHTAALVLGYQGEMDSGQCDHAADVKLRGRFLF